MQYNIVFFYPNVICRFNCQIKMGKSNVLCLFHFMYVFLPKISLICHIWAGASRWFFGWAFLNYFVHPNTTIKSQTRSSFKLHISLENETAGRFGLYLTFGLPNSLNEFSRNVNKIGLLSRTWKTEAKIYERIKIMNFHTYINNHFI